MLRTAPAALIAALVFSCSKTTPDSMPQAGAGQTAPPASQATPLASAPAAASAAVTAPDLPSHPPQLLDRRASCSDKLCKLDAFLPDPAYARSTHGGAESPAAMWVHEIRAGSGVLFPRHANIDVLAVVLAGALVASPDDAQQPRNIGPWGALYAPGGGVLLRAEGEDTAAIVLVATSLATLSQALQRTKDAAAAVRWQKRPGAFRAADLKTAEALSWGGGAFQARIAFGGEGPETIGASLESLQAKAGSTIPEHDHPSWEHIAILAGRGRFQLGGQEHPVEPGKIFHIPKGVRHAFVGTTDAPLLAIQSYTPSGQEQRFVKLAKGEPPKAAAGAPAPGK